MTLLTTSEAGEMMGLTSEQVRVVCVNGELEGARRIKTKRGHWRIPSKTVDAYLATVGRATVNRPATTEVMQAFDTIKLAVVAGIDAN